jgi:hypothetical protein
VSTLFIETLFDPSLIGGSAGNAAVSGGCELANTDQFNPATGIHRTNVSRLDAIHKITVPLNLLDNAARSYFNNFWRGGHGSAIGGRMRVPYDYIATDEVFGTGDGSETEFQLKVTYMRPGAQNDTRPGAVVIQDVRTIVKPVVDTVARLTNLGGAGGSVRLYEANGIDARVINTPFVIKINGTPTTAYTVNNTTGLVTFNTAPANGAILSWTGEFDTPVCFVGNSFQLQFDVSSEIQNQTFREILPAELEL